MKIKRIRLFPLMTAGVMTISQLMPAMTVLVLASSIPNRMKRYTNSTNTYCKSCQLYIMYNPCYNIFVVFG